MPKLVIIGSGIEADLEPPSQELVCHLVAASGGLFVLTSSGSTPFDPFTGNDIPLTDLPAIITEQSLKAIAFNCDLKDPDTAEIVSGTVTLRTTLISHAVLYTRTRT